MSLLPLLLNLLLIVLLTAVGPAEKTLGVNVRIVYLHGAWVWAALAGLGGAALAGLVGFLRRQAAWHRLGRALGRVGLFFWVTYLPISLWAMQTNWNGLFLAEPRWRMALIFAITGLLLQVGLALWENPAWASGLNLVFFIALMVALQNTERVMHPPAPILDSEAWRIQAYFVGLLALVLGLGAQAAWWLYRRDHPTPAPQPT